MEEPAEQEESDLSNSDDAQDASYLQVELVYEGLQFIQLGSGLDIPAGVVLDEADETGIALQQFGRDIEQILLKQNTTKLDPDLKASYEVQGFSYWLS